MLCSQVDIGSVGVRLCYWLEGHCGLDVRFFILGLGIKAPFTLQKKMGPDTLESGPDQFFLTVYTVSNHVRLTIEKNP